MAFPNIFTGQQPTTGATPSQGGATSWLTDNSDLLLALGSGLLGGRNAQEQLAGGVGGLVAYRQDAKKKNKTMELLKAKSPEIAQAVEAGILSPAEGFKAHLDAGTSDRKFQTLDDGTFGWSDAKTGTWTPLGKASKAATLPSVAEEYNWMKSQGYQGSPTDYLQMKKSGGNAQGVKAPSGYRWTDQTQSALEPIPGGPGEEMPGELAGRIGMAKNFVQRAPALRQKIANGDVTGVWDQFKAGAGIGETGQVYQDIQSGVDSLTRLMTGAGMNQTEAEAYTRRYLPTARDTAETATRKLDRLVEELNATAVEASKGRGGFNPVSTGGNEIDDLVRKYGG